MVSKFQIEKISSRIDALQAAISGPRRIEYKVELIFDQDEWAELCRTHPQRCQEAIARGHLPPVMLGLDDPAHRVGFGDEPAAGWA